MENLQGTDKFLVDFVVQPANKFSVYIDGDQGVTIQDCQSLSRLIESSFDRDNEDYDLTVSSAGLDHPIRTERQYRKNIGQEIKLVTLEGNEVEGVLISVGENRIELEHPVKKPKKEIKKPNSVISFQAIKTAKIVVKFGK